MFSRARAATNGEAEAKLPADTSQANTSRAGGAAGMRAALLGAGLNMALAALKVTAGVFGSSQALIADGIESLADTVASLVVWGGLRVAAAPSDSEHPYGHGRAESLAGMVAALALLLAALTIGRESVRQILTPHRAPQAWTLAVLLLVIAVKEGLFRVLSRIGAELESGAVEGDAWHHRADALTSGAAFVGISVALWGGDKWAAADDWAALLACTFIVATGLRLLRRAADELMDAAPPPALEGAVRDLILGVADVQSTHKLRLRKSGLAYLADVHIKVDGGLSVRQGHDIAHHVADALRASPHRIGEVTVHVEPVEPEL